MSRANLLMSTRNYQAIALDETSPWGYKVEHVALAGRYDDAIQSIEMMLSKMAQSPDSQIRGELCLGYGVKICFVNTIR